MDTDWETKPDELEFYLLNFAGLGFKIAQKVRGNFSFRVISHAEQVVLVNSLITFH